MTTADKINDDLHDMARAAGRNLRHYWDQNWQGKEVLETASASIQEKPLPSLLIALGVGVLVGFIVSRR